MLASRALLVITEPPITQTHNMRSVMTSNNQWILSLKLLLISSAVVSTAAVLKFSVPVVAEIIVSVDVPAMWNSIVFWLRPPYLYLLLNFIIITILASSMLHPEDQVHPPKLFADSRVDYTVHRAFGDDVLDDCDRDTNRDLAVDVSENDAKSDEKSMASERENDEIGEADRIALGKDDSMEILWQKPPLSSEIGNRKVVKTASTPTCAGMMNGGDTLEDAWKAITEGSSALPSRPLDKPDTFESHKSEGGRNRSPDLKVKKSETTATARVRKKASVTVEELNRQVEAFIEKFNQEMRLQREESLKKFQKMVNC